MIGHHQQKCALALVLACFVAAAASLAYANYKNQASSDVPLFSCPAGQEDAMQYFVLRKDLRENHYLSGEANPSYTKIFPDADFAPAGYWFWLKSSEAHGFDIKTFDEKYIYIRGTELNWKDNTTFKRKEQDTPLTARCVPVNGASPVLHVSNARFSFYANCKPYKTSSLGTIVNNLDAPEMMDAGGDIGPEPDRALNGAQTVGSIISALSASGATSKARVMVRLISLEDCPPDFGSDVTRGVLQRCQFRSVSRLGERTDQEDVPVAATERKNVDKTHFGLERPFNGHYRSIPTNGVNSGLIHADQ